MLYRGHGKRFGSTLHHNFLLWEEELITMGPVQGMMAYFSLSGPKMLFYIEDMRKDLVPLPIIIFFVMGIGDRLG